MTAFIYTHTLFSTKEYKIDSENNLIINALSSSDSSHEKIQLFDISASPKHLNHHNKLWLLLALLTAIAAPLLLLTLGNIFLPISTLLVICSILSTVAYSKNHTVEYRYIDSRSGKQRFSIKATNSKDKSTLNDFIKILNNKIKELQNSTTRVKKHKTIEFKKHLEHLQELSNIGIINEVLYQNIHTRIEEMVYGADDRSDQSNVIQLPVNGQKLA
ncbi:MAG: hypothetical protein V3U71_00960 [Cocleimonas sp.]